MEPSRRNIIFLIKRNVSFVLLRMEMYFLEAKLGTGRMKGRDENERENRGQEKKSKGKGSLINCLQRFCYMNNSAPTGSNYCRVSGTKDIHWFITHFPKSWWGLEKEKCNSKNKWTQSYFLTPFCLTHLTLGSFLLPISTTVLLFRPLSSTNWVSVAASVLLPQNSYLPVCRCVTRSLGCLGFLPKI